MTCLSLRQWLGCSKATPFSRLNVNSTYSKMPSQISPTQNGCLPRIHHTTDSVHVKNLYCFLLPSSWHFILWHVFLYSNFASRFRFSRLPFLSAWYMLRIICEFKVLHRTCTVVAVLVLRMSKRGTRATLLAWGYINTMYQTWIGILQFTRQRLLLKFLYIPLATLIVLYLY